MRGHFWNGRTVIVAGSTGFFGGWLVRALHRYGARVVAIHRSSKPESQFFIGGLNEQVQVEHGSVYDHGFVADLFHRVRPDFFFHAAYGADVNRVLEQPLECFRSSVESTWGILDLLRRTNPACVSIISSSDKAYGSQDLPYREDKPLTPMHPYEVAKASQDLIAQSYGKVFGLPVAITRCGNYFGPYDFNITRLIPGVVQSLVNGQRPVLRSDGRFTRDFLYVEDAVDAQLLLAERLSRDPTLRGEAFNFSYGEQLEVVDIVRRIIAIVGVDVEPEINDKAQAEIRHMHLSSEKAERLLGWKPHLGFDEGLRTTVAWYADHFTRRLRRSLRDAQLDDDERDMEELKRA